jgi:hypothetical protein
MTTSPPPPSSQSSVQQPTEPQPPAPDAIEIIAEELPEQDLDGKRAGALRTAFTRAPDKSVAVCNYENFAVCFPTAARENPKLLEVMHTPLVSYMKDRAPVQPPETGGSLENLLALLTLPPSL